VTGISYSSQYDIFTVGAGYLDIPAALASNDLAAGSAQSPTAAYDSATGSVYLVGGRGTSATARYSVGCASDAAAITINGDN